MGLIAYVCDLHKNQGLDPRAIAARLNAEKRHRPPDGERWTVRDVIAVLDPPEGFAPPPLLMDERE